ncbi:peptide chain release factor 1 [Halothiobacillus sp. DCM-1]|uniref:peptide chain release factor 1 n=1 Tax=Halothiobacillus sp. DCM-1 TaxID=3112558 RepID=UPI0038902C8F
MPDHLLNRLLALAERYEELTALLADPSVIQDQVRFRAFSREHARLHELVQLLQRERYLAEGIQSAQSMSRDGDAEIAELAQAELPILLSEREQIHAAMKQFLLPHDPADDGDVILEVRAGTGGDEAAIFAGDLLRMYLRYADYRGWQTEVLSEQPGEHGGFKEAIARISGEGVYAALKFESGAHRVQRVPTTETQGRIHTSAATVAVMPAVPEAEAITLDPSTLRIDTFRSSGAGGQHVNKTDSAIRITHLPTGMVVECQDERSQHKNKARALSVLATRLADRERQRAQAEQAATRKALVGSGDRSERIRTYNFPQGRVTDHRINLTLYQLDRILNGELNPVIEPLRQTDQTEQLMALARESS